MKRALRIAGAGALALAFGVLPAAAGGGSRGACHRHEPSWQSHQHRHHQQHRYHQHRHVRYYAPAQHVVVAPPAYYQPEVVYVPVAPPPRYLAYSGPHVDVRVAF